MSEYIDQLISRKSEFQEAHDRACEQALNKSYIQKPCPYLGLIAAAETLRNSYPNIEIKVSERQMLILNNRYEFSPKTRKWRNLGKAKWYLSKGVEDVVERFILNNAHKKQTNIA